MTKDKTYCIRSSKFYGQPCVNTDCDRHESNATCEDSGIRMWTLFTECKDYKHESHD